MRSVALMAFLPEDAIRPMYREHDYKTIQHAKAPAA